jgi:hypothetical protein
MTKNPNSLAQLSDVLARISRFPNITSARRHA